MQEVVDKIRLDLNKSRIRTSISICKGDTLCRSIYITLLNSGAVYEIPFNAIATLLAKKPDGRTVYNDCVIQDNEICYTVKNQLIAAAGDVVCQIKITSDNGAELYTPEFIIRVYEKTFDESILESTNDYSALQTYCMRAENAAQSIFEITDTMKASLKSVSSECQKAKEIAKTAMMVEEHTGKHIMVNSPYSVVMLTNIKGVTEYEHLPTHNMPVDPISLGENGIIKVGLSLTKEMDNLLETYEISINHPLKSAGNYADELCYKNHEIYVKRKTKRITLYPSDIMELDVYEGTSFEGKRHAYAFAVNDAVKTPSGIWYTCNRFIAQYTELNAAPAIDTAMQEYPGYIVLTTDMDFETFTEFVNNWDVEVIYALESATTNEVLDVNGIVRYEQNDTVYVAVIDTDLAVAVADITVQVPSNAFAAAVMELL